MPNMPQCIMRTHNHPSFCGWKAIKQEAGKQWVPDEIKTWALCGGSEIFWGTAPS